MSLSVLWSSALALPVNADPPVARPFMPARSRLSGKLLVAVPHTAVEAYVAVGVAWMCRRPSGQRRSEIMIGSVRRNHPSTGSG